MINDVTFVLYINVCECDATNSTFFLMAYDCDGMFPNHITEKILSHITLKQRPTASLVSKKWRDMIKLFNTFVQTHSPKISCGYCFFQFNPPVSCGCTDTETYRVLPTIRLAEDNISFKELYLFVPPKFRYCASPQILDSRLLTTLHIKGNCNMNYIREFNVMPSLKDIYFILFAFFREPSLILYLNVLSLLS